MPLKRLPQAERLLSGTLSAYLSAAATSATVNNPPDVNKLPTYIELEPDSDNSETVRVVAVAGNVITIERGVYNGGVGVEHQANSTYKQKISQLHWDAIVTALESGYITEDPSQTFTQNSTTEFQIENADHTAYYQAGRILRINRSADCIVESSELSGGHTVITVSGESLPTPITSVELAIQPRDMLLNIKFILNSLVDAKGDLIVASAADTPARLAVGSDGQFAIADSSQTTGLKYVSPDGWNQAFQTWTRESDNSFSEPIDATLKYKKGDKLRYKQGGAYKYQYVISVGAYSGGKTIITTTGGNDFVFTSGTAITDNYYSHQENPIGFPELFNYVPSWTNLTIGSATVVFKFNIINNVLKFAMSVVFAANTTISGNVSFSIPVNYSNVSGMYSYLNKIGQGSYLDDGVTIYEAIVKIGPTGKLNLHVLNTDTTYGISLNQINATVPITWTTNDRIDITADYFI